LGRHDEEEVFFGQIAEKEYWVDGKCNLGEFFALYDMEQEDENFESNTVGGWVMEECGEIPAVGHTLRYKNVEIKVVKTTRQKVLKIRSRYDESSSDNED